MEEHFKNKLKKHKVDWDKESLLGNLQEELSPKKSRFTWKWFLLLPLMLFATCWGWKNMQMPANNKVSSTQINSHSVLSEKENDLVKKNALSQNEINIENDELSSNTNEQANKKEAELPQSKVKQKLKILNSKTDTNTKTNLKVDKLQLPKTVKNPYKTTAKTFELRPENTIDIVSAKELANNPSLDIKETEKEILIVNPIPVLVLDSLERIAVQENLPALSITDILQKKDSLKLRNPVYFSGSGEIGLLARSRKFDSNNTELVKQLEKDEETETSLFAITTNFYIGYEHRSKWSLQSGLEYQELKEVFNYNKTTTENLLIEKTRYIIVDNMDTIFVQDTIIGIRTEERIVRHFNKHTLFSIPLQIGYRFDLKKVKLTSRLGLSYTFVHNFEGKMKFVNEDEGNEIFESTPEFGFELKNRIGLQAGLALEYPFLKQSQIFATATYRSSPSLTLGIIEQRHHSFSVGVGFKFSLGGSH